MIILLSCISLTCCSLSVNSSWYCRFQWSRSFVRILMVSTSLARVFYISSQSVFIISEISVRLASCSLSFLAGWPWVGSRFLNKSVLAECIQIYMWLFSIKPLAVIWGRCFKDARGPLGLRRIELCSTAG